MSGALTWSGALTRLSITYPRELTSARICLANCLCLRSVDAGMHEPSRTARNARIASFRQGDPRLGGHRRRSRPRHVRHQRQERGTVHDRADSQAAMTNLACAQSDFSVFALLNSSLRVADARMDKRHFRAVRRGSPGSQVRPSNGRPNAQSDADRRQTTKESEQYSHRHAGSKLGRRPKLRSLTR